MGILIQLTTIQPPEWEKIQTKKVMSTNVKNVINGLFDYQFNGDSSNFPTSPEQIQKMWDYVLEIGNDDTGVTITSEHYPIFLEVYNQFKNKVMSNNQILELRSKLNQLGIKTKWYDSVSQGNPTPMLQCYNQFEVCFGGGDTQTFDISDYDGNVSSFNTIEETINFIQTIK